ncbi:MAG: lytic transglycosylase domain-containing protein [Magnetococcales bacterium]|nr:lytic transglycosylase domain-containing protein [Magnetococcales bacterium]
MSAYAHSRVKSSFSATGALCWKGRNNVADRWAGYGFTSQNSCLWGLFLLLLLLISAESRAAVAAVSLADMQRMVQQVAHDEGVDAALLTAVVANESSFNPRAVSHKGAMGLMQLMPGTASDLGVRNPFDPEENLRGGARYLRAMLERFNNLRLALAAYNAGPNHVVQYQGVPPFEETRRYINRVLYHYQYGTPDRVFNRSVIFRQQGPDGRTLLTSRRVAGREAEATVAQPAVRQGTIRIIHRQEREELGDSYTMLRRIIITDRLPVQNRSQPFQSVARARDRGPDSRLGQLGLIIQD